jgi:uncharacterized damage-inducible protein DinB
MKPSQIFSHWKQVRKDLLETIDKFTQEELHYKPFETCHPAGRIMLHIADAEEGWFRYFVARQREAWPQDYTLEHYPTQADIKALLTEVHARTEAYLESLTEDDLERQIELRGHDSSLPLGWIIWHVLEHEIHHRGELSLILGMLGKEGLDV